MRLLIILGKICLSITLANRDPVAAWGASSIESKPKAKIKLHVILSSDEGFVHADGPIYYGFLALTNASIMIQILKPQYLCRLSLVDDVGREIKKTLAAGKFGARFDEAVTYSLDILQRRDNGKIVFDIPLMDSMMSFKLPPPTELFKLNKSGNYKLKLEMQVAVLDRNGRTGGIVRFGPIEVPINHQKKKLFPGPSGKLNRKSDWRSRVLPAADRNPPT